MKTSNKLLIAALTAFFLFMLVYDYMLRAELRSGRYKDPYYGFVDLGFKGFDAVDINSSTLNIKLIQGPFGIKADSLYAEFIKVKQQGARLIINTSYPEDRPYNADQVVLVISLPKLARLNVDSRYYINNKLIVDTTAGDGWYMRYVSVDGFKEDSLVITQDYGSTVILSNNQIGLLNACVGKSRLSSSKLSILKSNHIQNAKLSILNKSRFELKEAIIPNLNYQIADSAKLILTGAAKKLLVKQ